MNSNSTSLPNAQGGNWQPKGYIFDYGGTLDTNGNHWGKVIWHGYERQQVPIEEKDFRDAYVYAERKLGKEPIIQPDFTFKKTLATKLRIEMSYLVEKGLWNLSEFEFEHNLTLLLDDLYSGVKTTTAHSREVLLQLKEREPMVLVSNFYGNINRVLEEFQLDGIFEHIVESAVVGVRKPNPAIFTLGVKALGMDADETVVVGDSFKKDILPAKEAGCHTVWFKGEGWTDESYDETIPDKVITNLEQLI
jgi:putative hydrolase of the HAD superfamily